MSDLEQRIEELDQLVWALLDDQLTSSEIERLEQMLIGDEDLRKHYVRCMQLHADLHTMFYQAKERAAESVAKQEQVAGEEPQAPAIMPPLDIDLPIPGTEQMF